MFTDSLIHFYSITHSARSGLSSWGGEDGVFNEVA
jgi:hypothetical protein